MKGMRPGDPATMTPPFYVDQSYLSPITKIKLNGLVGLLYEHYGRSAGVKRSLIWSCVLCVTSNRVGTGGLPAAGGGTERGGEAYQQG